MKTFLKQSLIVVLATAAVPAVFGDQPKAAPVKAAPVKAAPPRSVFILPASPREGRDPFYPESTRPYEDNPGAKRAITDSFAVKGISIEQGRTMVIINNHTFAIGDEGDVLTTSGRVRLRLDEVRSGSVVIEVNGLRREIPIGVK